MTDQPPDATGSLRGASRRSFLGAAGAAALGGLALGACRADDGTGSSDAAAAPSGRADAADAPAPVPFGGRHQAGVLAAPAAAGIVAAFDVVATSQTELIETMQIVSAEIERLMSGAPAEVVDPSLPPSDSGAVGAEATTSGVAVTVAVGASLFDDRFGLADRAPHQLIAMPLFFNDRLVRDEQSHGDLALTISAPNQQAGVYALHQMVRVSERRLRLRWVQEGYNHLLPPVEGQVAPTRNLMGFRDGTSNLDTTDATVMDEHVWVNEDDDEPSWAVGGAYQAIRVIRVLVEFWATAALVRQEQIFGRHRDSGAPLGQSSEGELPAFEQNPADETVPRRSHMRLANPRTPGTGRILRRGFSYLNGVDREGTLDQGLLFMCFQRSLRRGFLEVQSRLDGEPLEDYVKPVGGGLFFVLPGAGDTGGWLGESLFA